MCGVGGRAVLDRMKTPSKRMTSVSPLNPTLNHLVKHQAPGKGLHREGYMATTQSYQLSVATCLALQFQPLRWSLLDPANLLFAGSSPPFSIPFPHHPPNSLPQSPKEHQIHFTLLSSAFPLPSATPRPPWHTQSLSRSQLNKHRPTSLWEISSSHCQAPNSWTQPTFLRYWNPESLSSQS